MAGRCHRHHPRDPAHPQLGGPEPACAGRARESSKASRSRLLLLFVTHEVFSGGPAGGGTAYATTFLIVPFVIWAALRFGQREVTTAITVICAIALWYTLRRDSGPFATAPLDAALVLLLLFVVTMVFTGLVLCALLGQLDEALTELRTRSRQLELRVSERTRDLEQANRLLHEDIAARSRTERMLADSERRFRLMVESVVDYAIFMLDAEGRVASWNAGAQRITGYEAQEILGAALLALLPARGRRAREAAMGARGGGRRGALRGGRLARAQGRLVLLGATW